ncbi:hypothetical protein EW026_g2610 [Hermanssonia centrifuga]|uniref:Serine/threonine-protein kinase TEL1 n=1 Tax=Hermanssonia centrifuga TaxID=98765 RepID=A0A4S4KNB4_9APHY|nr:hypothetical protein EW026_g2610 [Hermanssonia centrifuga]
MDVARSSELEELLTEKARETDEDGHTPLNQLMRRYADGIVTSIVRTLGDQDYSLEGPIVTALAEESASAAEEFGQLTSYRALSEFEPHEVNIPTLPTRVILRALSWFNLHVPVAEDTAVTYHVLHRLFADLERSPLVNEQMRLLNAICLWVARHHEHFDQAVLLRTLLNGAANIMGQCDLARGAQSLLQWVLLRRRIIGKDSQVAEIILRIGCMAHDYSINPAEDVARLGLDLLHWIEAETLELCKSKSLKGYVQKALSAWPRELPTTLQTVVQELPSESLSKILTDERISSYKFRLAKRLHELAAENSYDDEQFSKLDFWRLKECIPPARLISGEDIDSFSELLILQKGRIDGLESESSGAHTVRARHLLASRKESDDPIAPQRAIMASLLSILDDPSTTRSHLAFITLRSLVYIATSDPTGTRSWPLEHRQELELLKAYAYPAASRKHTELHELLSLTSHTELVEDFPRWIRFLATTLSDSLAVNESFYVPLAHILQAETQFPEQALPVLVHTVLLTERLRQQPKDGMTACQILSGYFTTILSSDISSASCRRAIVDTVLHLRQFPPPGTHDPLAHDKWLTVDFLLLSQNAIICGAYTTALLFLELATEYSDLASFDPSTVEQVLYNIYSHIDEPDGFYGIETQNLRQFLMKRFHHEKQWDKAFQFHSAALETREAESSDLDGALQALHSFGFNHMAMTALQGASGIDDALNSSSMTYHLGWRTGTWDLPEQPGFRNAGVPLYIALRAVYRERDSALVDSIVRRMSIQEMGALRSLGNENLTEIREATQNLMCIHQVRRWRDKDIQRDLQSKTMKDSHWEKFVDIDGNMDFPDLETIMACRISLIRSGTWASEACLEKPDYIKAQYFDVAASLARELDANEGSPNATHASVYHDYAIFAEHQYHAFKGEGDDDLRQDAVMEQVFELVNTVLRRDRDTLKRELRIRCYKVIPLASQAGVLEFVTNTTPLIVWLRKAHAKYRPKDISDDDCRKKMIAQRKKGNADDLKALFIELREQFKPVMRHYFTESHKTPMSWFKMRLNYARSVATTSIVGHILGLGDRHLSNILLDNNNGEVVHIDLDLKGKLLPIPERVPFRLTADMVDGLGTSGTQGVFQRCAEETLRVLRNDSEVILTVLEVFKYDPLHSWTASELKVKRAQSVPDANTALLTGEAFRFVVGIDMSAGMADEAADRALQGVTRKLDKSLSIEFTVNELIAEATDPFNLANMFIGWSPQY